MLLTASESHTYDLTFFYLFRFEEIFEELRMTYAEANRTKKLQILTLSPFGFEETKKYFNATNHMVQVARNLKKEHGILPEVPLLSKGKVLSRETKQFVLDFFESDEISRQCPGLKDCKSSYDLDGNKVMKQKKLVLGNLKEVYQKFKESENHPDIGFSTFCSLRPKHCVLAGGDGTHSVCVCTYHQNPKLQLNAIGEKDVSLEDVMSKAVCDINSENCMMRKCKNCPGESGVSDFVEALPAMEGKEEIRYSKWVSVDRCSLEEVVESVEDFLKSFSKAIVLLTRHHYVSKKQSEAYRVAKESLKEDEVLVVGDFAENYSFVVQNAAQGQHWNNSQCTLHPFVCYFRGPDSTIQHESFCFISDCTKHSTAMVHTFLKTLIPLLKDKHPTLKKVIYFSDGCAGQYKNRFNFLNLAYHEFDFDGIIAVWHFFATSHGKNPCDGIGGTSKRLALKASLQRTDANHILSAKDFFDFCTSHIAGITYFFTTKDEVEATASSLQPRFSEAMTIPGTQKHHYFAPIGNGYMEISEISHASSERKTVKICSTAAASDTQTTSNSEETLTNSASENLIGPDVCEKSPVGSYVVVEDSSKMWVGFVDRQDDEFGDYLIRFLHPSGVHRSYAFPDDSREQCFKSADQIIGILPDPSMAMTTRIRYYFEMDKLNLLMQHV